MVLGGGRLSVWIWLVAAWLGACGGSGVGGPGSAGSGGCAAACTRCGSDLCADCAATPARLLDEFESSVYACVQQGSDASCSTLWERCVVQAETQVPRRPIDDSYRDACLAKR